MSDAGGPVAAVERFFAAWRDGQDAAPYVTGPLADDLALRGELSGDDLLRQEVELLGAHLVEQEGAEAIVAVEGTVRTAAQDPYSGAIVTRDDSLTGPVKALLAEGAWRVADYSLGGKRALAGLTREVEGAGEARGVAASAVAVLLAHGSTWLYVDVANARHDAVRLRRANLHVQRLLPKRQGRVYGARVVPAGSSRLVACEWRLALRQARGEVRLLAYGEAEQERIEIRFRMRAGAAERAYFEPLRIGGEPRPPRAR